MSPGQDRPAPMPARQRLAVLGATGSIGASTLDLVRRHPDRFEVVGLSANRDVEQLVALAEEFRPQVVCLADASAASAFRLRQQGRPSLSGLECLEGSAGLCLLAGSSDVDTVVAGIVGIAGLASVWSAVQAGHRVLLANKEAMVCAGDLLVQSTLASGALMLPIDSEHNAIFQCLGTGYRCFERPSGVRRLILTASGGPFREWSAEAIRGATVEEAVKHPTWSMGRKISVDSASLMNKGLELIEAHWLFQVPSDALEVVVHPESVIHSMVEFSDGSTLAQLGSPDMRSPIASALAWPDRIESGVAPLDWTSLHQLRFELPDLARFPALRLARECLAAGSMATNLLNAANEQAVAAFLDRRICFGDMQRVCDTVVQTLGSRLSPPVCLDDVFEIDRQARLAADYCIGSLEP